MELPEIIARICQDVFTHSGPLPARQHRLLLAGCGPWLQAEVGQKQPFVIGEAHAA